MEGERSVRVREALQERFIGQRMEAKFKDGLLSQRELADLLCKSEVTIYRWRVSYGLPYLTAGKAVLIRWEDIIEWSERRAAGKHRPRGKRERGER